MHYVQDYSLIYNNAARHVICEGWYFIITLLAMLYVRVGILHACRKHLHDHLSTKSKTG